MVLVNVNGSCFGILLWYLPPCIQGFNKIRIFKSHYEDLKNPLVKSKKKYFGIESKKHDTKNYVD